MYYNMMKIVIVICVFIANIKMHEIYFDLIHKEFENFKIKYHKNYSNNIENEYRFKIFIENLNTIIDHNKNFENGVVSFELGINQFTDMLYIEVIEASNGITLNDKIFKSFLDENNDWTAFITPENIDIPDKINWTEKGAVTQIKDQGMCGSCWAFSATGALEGQHFRSKNQLTSISEQNLVDCSGKFGNKGCNGGWMPFAYKYVQMNNGIDSEISYPYLARKGQCHFTNKTVVTSDKGFVTILGVDQENKLMEAVATIGPISVAIDASHDSFVAYKSGIYYEPRCSSTNVDHGVLVVGYGTDNANQDYWLVKNSWGTTWGENGYIKMARNKNNNCAIASYATYPLV